MPKCQVLAVVRVGMCMHSAAVFMVWRLTTAWGLEEVHSH